MRLYLSIVTTYFMWLNRDSELETRRPCDKGIFAMTTDEKGEYTGQPATSGVSKQKCNINTYYRLVQRTSPSNTKFSKHTTPMITGPPSGKTLLIS